jgi:hypothetical protein
MGQQMMFRWMDRLDRERELARAARDLRDARSDVRRVSNWDVRSSFKGDEASHTANARRDMQRFCNDRSEHDQRIEPTPDTQSADDRQAHDVRREGRKLGR